jgi:hypothetical protein
MVCWMRIVNARGERIASYDEPCPRSTIADVLLRAQRRDPSYSCLLADRRAMNGVIVGNVVPTAPGYSIRSSGAISRIRQGVTLAGPDVPG